MAPLILALMLSLGSSGPQQNAPLKPDSLKPATSEARRTGPDLDALVKRFEDERWFWRQLEIAREIARTSDRSVLTRLESWLSSDDRHVRANAAFVFAALGDPRGLAVIESILHDRSARPVGQGVPGFPWTLARQISTDRYYAVHVLGKLADAKALPILAPLLDDPEINYNIAWALGEIGDRRAVRPLTAALRDRDALVRSIAIRSLVKLAAKEVVPELRLLLDDHAMPNAGERTTVAETARSALSQLEREP